MTIKFKQRELHFKLYHLVPERCNKCNSRLNPSNYHITYSKNLEVALEDNIPVCQYTGLKDKNDQEIYEGDICKIKGFNRLGTKIDYINKAVVYYDGIFGFEFGSITIEPLCNMNECVIIGNIFENPELLGE